MWGGGPPGEAALSDHRDDNGQRRIDADEVDIKCTVHALRVTQACLAEFGDRLRLHFLPPYCPDENRIERLWLDLHAHVTRNHRNRTSEALLERVHGYFAERFDIQRRFVLVA